MWGWSRTSCTAAWHEPDGLPQHVSRPGGLQRAIVPAGQPAAGEHPRRGVRREHSRQHSSRIEARASYLDWHLQLTNEPLRDQPHWQSGAAVSWRAGDAGIGEWIRSGLAGAITSPFHAPISSPVGGYSTTNAVTSFDWSSKVTTYLRADNRFNARFHELSGSRIRDGGYAAASRAPMIRLALSREVTAEWSRSSRPPWPPVAGSIQRHHKLAPRPALKLHNSGDLTECSAQLPAPAGPRPRFAILGPVPHSAPHATTRNSSCSQES